MTDHTKRKQQVQRTVCPLRRKVTASQQSSQRRDRLDMEMLGDIELGDSRKLGSDRRRARRARKQVDYRARIGDQTRHRRRSSAMTSAAGVGASSGGGKAST
ncbi:MAG: hypothetical protein QOE31_743, partial [Solirubrobacteraceae bacterium]|nr:hypothetical protein [Solirubrobacteraceae bacterium]